MQQKSKPILAMLSIVAFLIVGFIFFNGSKSTPQIANAPHAIKKIEPIKIKSTTEKSIITTSPITGNKSIDSSINNILNSSLSEDDLDKEFSDANLNLSTDEESLNQINNLSNNNEL